LRTFIFEKHPIGELHFYKIPISENPYIRKKFNTKLPYWGIATLENFLIKNFHTKGIPPIMEKC